MTGTFVEHRRGGRATIVVIGMHRAGTSATAELLCDAGAWVGEDVELLPADMFNEHGYFERLDVAKSLDDLLASLGGEWLQPPLARLVPSELERVRPTLRRIFATATEAAPPDRVPLVKDPRLSLFAAELPTLLPPSSRIVVCIRHPLEVARSLYEAHALDIPLGLALWEAYYATLCAGLAEVEVLPADYGRVATDPKYVQTLVLQAMSPLMPADWEAPQSRNIDIGLRHQMVSRREERQWLSIAQLDMWTALSTAAATGECIRLPIATLSAQAEDELRRAAEFSATRRTLSALQNERSEQQAQIGDLGSRLAEATTGLSDLAERLDEAKEQAAGAASERDRLSAALLDREQDLLSALRGIEEQSEAVRELERALRDSVNDGAEHIRLLSETKAELVKQATRRETQDLALADLQSEVTKLAAERDGQRAALEHEQRRLLLSQEAEYERQVAIEALVRDCDDLRLEVQSLRTELGAREAHQASQLAEMQLLLRRSDDLASTLDTLNTTLSETQLAYDALRVEADGLESQFDRLDREVEYKQFQLAAIAKSRSWRLTAPLRWTTRLLGRGDQDLLQPPPDSSAAPPDTADRVRQRPMLDETPTMKPNGPEFVLGTGFDETTYLDLHSDVAAAVAVGDMPSGYEHFMLAGRSEGRLAPGFAPHAARAGSLNGLRDKPMGLTIVGPLSALSGLGTSARGYVQASQSAGLLTVQSDVDVYGSDRGEIDEWGATTTRAAMLVQNADILPRLFARHDQRSLDDTFVIGVWVWEIPGLRSEWHSAFGAVDEVWAPSNFCGQAIHATSPVPVHVVPYVVAGAPDDSQLLPRAHFGIPDDTFAFLYAFDASSHLERKNPMACVAAFRAAFGQRDDVRLLLKMHSTTGDDPDVRDLLEAVSGVRNIQVIDDRLTESQMWSLKAAADCFASPHRSEGFGLNIAESMLLGKPVISTDFSGPTDFVTSETGYPLAYRLRTVGREVGPYQSHSVWAEPDHDDLVSIMRHVVASPSERARKGHQAAALIRKMYSAEAIGLRLRARLDDVGLGEPSERLEARLGASKNVTERHPLGEVSKAARAVAIALPDRPTISVVVPVFNIEPSLLEACVESVRRQSYPFWELCLTDDGSTSIETIGCLERLRGSDPRIKIARLPRNSGISAATNHGIAMSGGEFVALLDNDDELAPQALLRVAETILANPAVDLLYTDEDKLDPDGSHSDDYHKPDWSPELLESTMYLLHMLVIRKSLLLQLGGLRSAFDGAQDYDLALRLSRATSEIVHLPEVLYHWRKIPGSAAEVVDAKPYGLQRAQAALQEHAQEKYGADADVVEGTLPGLWRVRRGRLDNPPVSLLITTNNGRPDLPGRGPVTLIDNLVNSITQMTDYPNYQIVIVDNQNLSKVQREGFRASGHRVVAYTGPQRPFNFADKANFTFAQSETDFIVLLNDDLEVIERDWLGALVGHLKKPDVGVVGAKLLSLEGRIQHAGVVAGVNGSAAHAFYGMPGDAIGYNGYTHVDRNYSMVTGACMATRRDVLAATGGLDRQFAIDFNDSDFCLSAISRGYRVVYTPHAVLRHFESVTVPRTAADPTEAAAFRRKWAWSGVLTNDPFYNPNLSPFHVDFRRRNQLDGPVR